METPRPNAWQTFWKTVVRFQSEKINPWMALRNTAGMVIPLAVGAVMGNITGGVIAATGALNVSFRDSGAPYGQRARQMLLASVTAGLTVFAGMTAGHSDAIALILVAIWTFAAGMLVSISDAAADLGTMSVVLLVIYAANPTPLHTAVLAGIAALAGGLLQTALAISSWPFRRYSPERRALGDLYLELARAALNPAQATEPPLATPHILAAQKALAPLGRDQSAERDRYRFLLSQAERIRLSLLALGRIRGRLGQETPPPEECALLDRCLQIAANALEKISSSLHAGEPPRAVDLQELDALADELRGHSTQLEDARYQVDALAGQLRAALDVAGEQPAGALTSIDEAVKPWRLRAEGKLATFGANLNLQSTAFRHAIRLAVCVFAGEALGRGMGFRRPYWIPMTIAIVLKPDFGGTFQRGILRLAGTYAGLLLATIAFREVPDAAGPHIVAIAALMFVVRCFGPANYGVVATAISALIVFLFSLTGIAAKEVIGARALNTSIGGAIALLAYWLWPTWERYRVSETAAKMLDAFREYFHAIRERGAVEQKRAAGRLARSNLEASITRASSEPGVSAEHIVVLTGILASSRRLAQSLLSLEAAGPGSGAEFDKFADDVEKTLRRLARALRRSKPQTFPDLREDHHALIHSGDRDSLINVETDRITNSLNTLSLQILRWIESA